MRSECVVRSLYGESRSLPFCVVSTSVADTPQIMDGWWRADWCCLFVIAFDAGAKTPVPFRHGRSGPLSADESPNSRCFCIATVLLHGKRPGTRHAEREERSGTRRRPWGDAFSVRPADHGQERGTERDGKRFFGSAEFVRADLGAA